MKTIAVNKTTRDMLETVIREDETMDKLINRLLSSAKQPMIIDKSKTNINIEETTLNKLKEFKSYSTESHNDVIFRLLNELEK